MALALHHFIRGTLITTPPFIYIFVGDVPMNSLVGDVNSASQESNMNSDDPNALPLEDSINSDVLPPNQVNPQENNALPQIDQAVDDGNAKESDPGVPTAEPVVDNVAKEREPGVTTGDSVVDSGDVKDTNPKVSEGVSENTKPGVANEPSQDSAPVADELSDVDDETDDDESTGDPSKNNEFNEKLKDAGIDNSCFLPNLKTVGKCTLTKEQLERINFPQREDEDDDLEISGLGEDEKVTLTIESGYDEDDFPEGGLRLTFHNPNSSEVEITGGGNSDASLKPNIDHDYMFSSAQDKWIDKAWSSLQKLGAKVGLNINNVLEDDTCTARNTQNKINVWKSRKEYVIGADNASDSTCPMEAEDNVSNLLEGFKLKVKGEKDVPLSGGKGPEKGTTIDTLKKNASYSFAPKRVEGKKVWFLIENK